MEHAPRSSSRPLVRLALACALPACSTQPSPVVPAPPKAPPPAEPAAPPEPGEEPRLSALRTLAEELRRRGVPAAPPSAPDEPEAGQTERLDVPTKKSAGKKSAGKRGPPGLKSRPSSALELPELWALRDLGRPDGDPSEVLEYRRQIDRLLDPQKPRPGGLLQELKDDLVRAALFDGLLKDMKTRSIIGINDIVSPITLTTEPPPTPELSADYAALRDTMLGTLRHTAMMVKASALQPAEGGWRLTTQDVYKRFSICPDEDYVVNEDSAGECSAIVLTRDTILTARHCLKEFQRDGSDARFVFEFAARADGKPPTSFPASAVFDGAVLQQGEGNGDDWVIFKTSRPLPPGRIPRLSLTPTPASVSLFAAGYPLGAPFKVIRQGNVLRLDETRIYTDLDAYQGTSGAPVFNVFGEVEAIIVEGGRDFDQVGPCRKTHVCQPPACRPEEAFRLSAVFRQLRAPS